MTSFDEAGLRNWLVDYLVTNVGCSPDDIDFEAPLNDLGVGSRDAVVLSGELSELVGHPVSPVEFWQHPTLNALARFLAGAEPESAVEAAADRGCGAIDEPVAVIGLGCRFPGGIAGSDEYWQFLDENRSAVGQVPPGRWAPFVDGSPEAVAAMSRTTRWGSFLTGIDAFDSEFFDITPSEADKMDPQQRLVMEVAYEAIEHAGIPAVSLRRSQTGVFIGACVAEYGYLATSDLSQVDAWSGTGGALSIVANRVSYFFDLRGPSVAIDTACSSSLVAVHTACQSLRTGESNLALAGGVNLLLSPAITRSFDRAEAMSATGRCHAFDASADGFVRGEGCGVVVLKRLSDAQRDGDRLLAVIRGSAVNQDGRSNGLMAPNPAAQMAVLRAAYVNAGVDTRDVDYVEAHGTGTLLGDPIEARALGAVLGRGRAQDKPLLIGAVKSNLGHLEAAAGIAGFIKAVLAVQRAHVPANLGFETPNPHIPFDHLRLKVVAKPTDWPSVDRPRRAGVSSFGFGGTNAHVVLEQPPVQPSPGADVTGTATPAVITLIVSGKTPERIASLAETLADWMSGAGSEVSLPDVAHTLHHHRDRHAKFATVAAGDRLQAIAGLRALADGQVALGVVGPHDGVCRPGTVFVYSGQGSQWAGMGQRLLAEEPQFAAAVAELEPDFIEQVGFSLVEVLESGEPVVGIDRIQPVLVGVQLALTALWESYGVVPDAVIGHSMGEVAAAVTARALTPAEGLRVIATRSRLMSALSGQGAMALVELDAAAAADLIARFPGVTLAVHASLRQTVIAGAPNQVDAVIAAVEGQDRLARRIEVDVASHHPIIDPVLPQLLAELSDLSPRPASMPVFTTTLEAGEPTFDAEYWAANLRNPVRFSQAVSAAGAEYGTFIEVSPHPVLTYAIDDTLGQAHHHSVGTLARHTDDSLTFHTNLNATHTTRAPEQPHLPEPHPIIPNTPWRRTHHWISRRQRVSTAGLTPRFGTLLGEHISVATSKFAHLWRAQLVPEAKPYPGSHVIRGVEVVPVSVLLQTLLVAAAECGVPDLGDIRFEYPIVLDEPRLIQVVADDGNLTLSSRPAANESGHRWVRHAGARLSQFPSESGVTGGVSGQRYAHRNGAVGEMPSAAQLLQKWGVQGQTFPWSVESLWQTADGIVADIRLEEPSTVALLDAGAHLARLADPANQQLMVPARVEAVQLTAELAESCGSVHIRRRDGEGLVVDVDLQGPDGTSCLHVRSLSFVAMDSSPAQAHRDVEPRQLAHEIDWRPWNHLGAVAQTAYGPLAVVGRQGGAADALRDRLAALGYPSADLSGTRYVLYVADPEPAESDLDAAVRMSAEVSDLVRTLAQRNRSEPATLWIITRGVFEAISDAALPQSILWGITAVIAAEQPDVCGGLVDLPSGDDVAAHAPALSTMLSSPSKCVLVLRDGEFRAPTITPISGRPVRDALRCRPDGAYLVTGGLGALGLLTADWLVDRGARRLVLAGRSGLPPRRDWDRDNVDADARIKIAAVRALEMRGVSVDVVALDVGSGAEIRTWLGRRDRDGAPPIRGLIHAAGVTANKLLTDTADDLLRNVMWPKVAGAQALHEAFPPGSLDFFFLTASAGTVFGIPGQGAYAAANAYLDCLARARHRQGCHTMSLDWVAWQGLGFASDAEIVLQELQRLGSRPVNPDEAFAAWEYVAGYDIAQAVMVPMPSDDLQLSAGSGGIGTPELVRAWSQMTAECIVREMESGLRTILARELRMAETEIEADRPFAELGLNSVMAMSIRRDAEQLVGMELSATMLWNHPTIAALATYLAEKLAPEGEPKGVDAMPDSTGSVLDSLFESIESSAGLEGWR
jgi:phthiocerol/phenolphthiocerol synthesis type-I polyketide synthase A